MRVFECSAADEYRWNEFVAGNSAATYAHRFEWKRVIENAYGLRAPFLAAEEGGRWIGVFPVAAMPRFPGCRARAVSLAFCNYGDVLATDADRVRTAVLDYLAGIGIDTVEVRALGDATAVSPIATLMLDLPAGEEALWRQVGDKVRNQVRKARKSGLTVDWSPGGLDDFHAVYADNLGRLGTPVHSARFFREMAAAFAGDLRVLVVRDGLAAAGAMLSIVNNNMVVIGFAATRREARQSNAAMLLYWEALRMACAAGMARVDFGRSPVGSGPYRFKAQWGAQPLPLVYRTFRNGAASEFSAVTAYQSPPARFAAAAWKLLPRGLQLGLGPRLRRWMP